MSTINYAMNELRKETAIAGTIKRYGKQLLSFIRERVGSLEDAEDILQDTWYQFSNLTDVREIESVSGWLYAVTRNRITDFYRKRKTSRLEDFTYEEEEGEREIRDLLLLDDSADPELILFRELILEELFIALKELPENQRSVFILNEIEDKTLQEIADEQGENLKTIISRKGYAVKHLRKRLLPLYNELTNKP
jgi:RNA polymerase sigma factor (sigma-70 family)